MNHQSGTLYPDSEVEPQVAVDPTNPDHIVGVFQQDRWSNGAARGLIAGVSFDGGNSWKEVVIPGLSLCSGGTLQRVSDPWLSFDSQGDLYSIGLPAQEALNSPIDVSVNKSTDGGLTWSDPVVLINDTDPRVFDDKEEITADPTDSHFAYAVWDRTVPMGFGYIQPEMFSRTTDGGQTWEPPRAIYDAGVDVYALDSQILVLPNGTVVDVFTEYRSATNVQLLLIGSTDRGETWQPPVQIATMQGVQVRDPNTGHPVRTSSNGFFDAAVDPNTGNLYVVWEDARFSSRQHNSIALSTSTDGGFTWSAPVQVNQTPTDMASADQQAFLPAVQVAGDGTVGVTYYDFRFNSAGPGLPTDYWFVHGRLNHSGVLYWGHELRLTDQSFDLETAPDVAGGLFNTGGWFLGDYAGLAASGSSFASYFAQSHESDPADVFFRAINRGTAGAPGGAPASFVLPTDGITTDTLGLFDLPVVAGASFSASPNPTSVGPSNAAMLQAGMVTKPLDEVHVERFFQAGDRDNIGPWALSPSDAVALAWTDAEWFDILR